MEKRCLIIAPHPDDETLGAGMWMDRHADCDVTVLHLTDGSPRDGRDARAAGLTSLRAYALARRRELREALRFLTRGRRRLRAFSYVDQESFLHLPEIITRMIRMIEAVRPEVVLSPAYEGGHPDHDTAAFATAMARRRVSYRFAHREFPLYHAGPAGEMVSGAFLPGGLTPVETLRLTEAERGMKRRMLSAFGTQAGILSRFEVSTECFRDAPEYDFRCPPHEGRLLYEIWNLGVSGADWRLRASEAFGNYQRALLCWGSRTMSHEKPFLADVQELRSRARKSIEKGAVTPAYQGDVKQTIDILQAVLATEIVCVLRYTMNAVAATGISSDSVKEEFDEHAEEERGHMRKVAERINQLGGTPDFNPEGLASRSASQYVIGANLVEMIRENLVAERIACEHYRELIRYFADGDPTTRVMMEGILTNEEEHANDMHDLLVAHEGRPMLPGN